MSERVKEREERKKVYRVQTKRKHYFLCLCDYSPRLPSLHFFEGTTNQCRAVTMVMAQTYNVLDVSWCALSLRLHFRTRIVLRHQAGNLYSSLTFAFVFSVFVSFSLREKERALCAPAAGYFDRLLQLVFIPDHYLNHYFSVVVNTSSVQ